MGIHFVSIRRAMERHLQETSNLLTALYTHSKFMIKSITLYGFPEHIMPEKRQVHDKLGTMMMEISRLKARIKNIILPQQHDDACELICLIQSKMIEWSKTCQEMFEIDVYGTGWSDDAIIQTMEAMEISLNLLKTYSKLKFEQ